MQEANNVSGLVGLRHASLTARRRHSPVLTGLKSRAEASIPVKRVRNPRDQVVGSLMSQWIPPDRLLRSITIWSASMVSTT